MLASKGLRYEKILALARSNSSSVMTPLDLRSRAVVSSSAALAPPPIAGPSSVKPGPVPGRLLRPSRASSRHADDVNEYAQKRENEDEEATNLPCPLHSGRGSGRCPISLKEDDAAEREEE